MSDADEFWMSKCIRLAKRGAGFVSPNPLVGAVIVKNGKKISEGYHRRYGEAHAEINAINQAVSRKKKLSGATLYVNLEPCFHYGKTPPCVDAIVEEGISRVVIATKDPNPLVSGKSIKKLKHNGIKCTVGVLRSEAEELNEKFFTFINTGLPFVALKAAQTFDGFIAKTDGTSKWITNEHSRKFVHQLRTEYDAVIVGANTVLKDNPELTVRSVKGRNPIRIVIDGKSSVDPNHKIFNTKASTIIYTAKGQLSAAQNRITGFEKKGVVVIPMKARNGKVQITDIMKDLGKHQIASVLIEGGQKIFSEFINAGVVHKMYLFTAKKKFGSGIKTFENNIKPITLVKQRQKKFGSDILEVFCINATGK